MQHAELEQYRPRHPAYTNIEEMLRCRMLAQSLGLKSLRAEKKLTGRHLARDYGRGLEFEELRLYQAGDDIRSIDWRVTARTGKTHTRLYTEERELPTLLILDQSAQMFFGSQHCLKSVLACQMAAIISWQTLFSGDRVGTLVFNDDDYRYHKPQRSRQTLMQALQDFCNFNQQLSNRSRRQPGRLEDILQLVSSLNVHASNIIIISDFFDSQSILTTRLSRLKQKNQLRLIEVSDPLEISTAITSNIEVSNGQKAFTLSQNKHREFLSRRQQQRAELQQWATNHAVNLHNCSTAAEPAEWLGALLQ